MISSLLYMLSRLMLIAFVFLVYATLAWAAWLQIGPLLLVFLIMAAIRVRFRRGDFTAFGTARWADSRDLEANGILGARTGIVIGRVLDDGTLPFFLAMRQLFNPRVSSRVACRQFLASIQPRRKVKPNPKLARLPHAIHTAVIAPAGAGKNVSIVEPFLMVCKESIVCVDFKGENADITADYRKRRFGHRIVRLDPFKVVSQTPDRLNPLDFIDKNSPTAPDESRSLAEALVMRSTEEREPHWCDSAVLWIASMIALVVYYGEPSDRSLQTIRNLLTNADKLSMAIKLMCASDAWNGVLARWGGQLLNYKDKELSSTLTTTNRFLNWLDSIAVFDSTKSSSFDPREIRNGKMTVYLILPAEHARTQAPLLRMWITSLLQATVRCGLGEQNKVHFVLDEAAAIGHLPALDDAVNRFRGYGVRTHFILQYIGQMKKCFPDAQDNSILSNFTQIFFGVRDINTADYVSSMLGDSTIVLESGGAGTGTSHQNSSKTGDHNSGSSTNESENWSQGGRKLLRAEEVLALSPDLAITFTPGVPPIMSRLIRYYEENFDRYESLWFGRLKAIVFTVGMSASLLFAALMIAKAVSEYGFYAPALRRVPTIQRQTLHDTRKADTTCLNATFPTS